MEETKVCRSRSARVSKVAGIAACVVLLLTASLVGCKSETSSKEEETRKPTGQVETKKDADETEKEVQTMGNEETRQDGKPETEQETEQETDPPVNIDAEKSFISGNGDPFVVYGDKVGLVRKDGTIYYEMPHDIIFSWDSDKYYTEAISDDLQLIRIETSSRYKYKVVDQQGRVTLDSENKEEFDGILCYAEGMFFVYKDTSDFSQKSFAFGVVDGYGKWITPLTKGPSIVEYISKVGVTYVGEGMCCYYVYGDRKDSICFLNSQTNQWIIIDRTEADTKLNIDIRFVNGAVYGMCTSNSKYDTETGRLITPEGTTQLPWIFKLHKTGKIEEISEDEFYINAYAGGFMLYTEYYEEHRGYRWTFYDPTTNTGVYIGDVQTGDLHMYREYVQYAAEDKVFGSYVVGQMTGADGYSYHVLLSAKAKKLFDPVKSSDYSIAHENRVCFKLDGIYSMTDLTGKVLVDSSRGYKKIHEYSDGYAVCELKGDLCEVIDMDGNVVISRDAGYKFIGSFYNGVASAQGPDGKGCLIDTSGNPIYVYLADYLKD